MNRSPRLTTATSWPLMRKPRTCPSANSLTSPTRCFSSATLFDLRVVFERHEDAQAPLRPVARDVADAGQVLDQGQHAGFDDELLAIAGLDFALPGDRGDHLATRADVPVDLVAGVHRDDLHAFACERGRAPVRKLHLDALHAALAVRHSENTPDLRCVCHG